jgi:predicted anti-sigma-YlaC factor YlaD
VSHDTRKMSCEEFQAQLAEIIGSGENAAEHEHIRSCELCRALLADLETIAEAARQLFPVEEPPELLWEKIETAIKKENTNGQQPSTNGVKGKAERGLTHKK